MRQNLLKIKPKCPIEIARIPCYGTKLAIVEAKVSHRTAYETELVDNQAKMSHRIAWIPCYGTKSVEIEAKVSHRTAL